MGFADTDLAFRKPFTIPLCFLGFHIVHWHTISQTIQNLSDLNVNTYNKI